MTNNLPKIFTSLQNVVRSYNSIEFSGEIVSFKISGANAYVTVKTSEFEIKCIYWRIKQTTNLTFSSGEKCKIEGKFAMFNGKFEIYFSLTNITKEDGVGTYIITQHQNREKIFNNGYHLNKKTFNGFPYNVGIVTAVGGAAIQDILQVFRQDGLIGNIYIKSALVQGNKCAESVIAGIRYFENNPQLNIQLLLITRGGGSYEDLIEFSNWNLIEYINKTNISSPFITISAIGHQIDNQLTDDICSYHFATPSISAKFIVETQKDNLKYIQSVKQHCSNLSAKLFLAKKHFASINYEQIINRITKTENYQKLSIINDYIGKTLKNYNNCKMAFANKINNMKPTMIKEKELSSIYGMVENPAHVTNKLSKMDIIFYDGRVKISYRITECEFF